MDKWYFLFFFLIFCKLWGSHFGIFSLCFPFLSQEQRTPSTFLTFRDRLHYLQVTVDSFSSYSRLKSQDITVIPFYLFIYICLTVQATEKGRVCFGKSGIHGWGLFARRNIQEGEMVHILFHEIICGTTSCVDIFIYLSP